MYILSWNVNGIRAINRKELLKPLFEKGIVLPDNEKSVQKNVKIDILGFQETKATYGELSAEFFPEGYAVYHNSATERKGYSGTAIFVANHIKSNLIDVDVTYETLNTEGRMICVEIDEYVLINCYFPNGGGADTRLAYKLKFYDEFTSFCTKIQKKTGKKLLFWGDLNIAHKEIDLARPKENEKHVGFLPEERLKLDVLHETGFIDLFRLKYPETVKYTWWDMKTRSRDRNIGWRIDSFYGSESVSRDMYDIYILDDIQGSDHCPVVLKIA